MDHPTWMTGDNDVETLLVEDHARAISCLVVSLPVGSLDDPPGKEGLAYLTGQMLLRGAADMDHARLTDEIDFLGSSLSVGVGRERTSLTGDALTRNLDVYEQLASAALATPSFDPAELDKLKRQTLAELEQIRDSDTALGQRFFVRRLFPDHPYGRPLRGSERTIAAITIDDVRAFYAEHYTQRGALVGAAGDIDGERLATFVARTVGRLPVGAPREVAVPKVTAPSGYRMTLVDKPERSQTQVFIGHTTVDANDDAYMPLLLGHTLFGGTFTARLSHEIREKRGWSYGAYSYLSTDRHLGTFMLRFYPSVKDTVPALQLADELFRALVADGVTAEELAFAKSYLANGHAFSIDTPERLLSELMGARLAGRPADFVTTFVDRVQAVTVAQVNAAMAAHLTPDDVRVTVVATAADLDEALSGWQRVTARETLDHALPIDEV